MTIRELLVRQDWPYTVDRPVVGLDIGSRSSKGVLIDREAVFTVVEPTGLYTQETADALLDALLEASGVERREIGFLVGTGYGRVALDFPDLDHELITEIRCHAMGAHVAVPSARTIIDIGGQDSKAIRVDPANGQVVEFVMNDKCAAGTGRFLEKSAATLGVELEAFGRLSLTAPQPSQVSSQCVVFAETEIISLRAKGEQAHDSSTVANIAAGVHLSAARRVQSLLGRVGVEPGLVFTGGVSNNPGMRSALEGLIGQKFLHPRVDLVLAGALGAAVYAAKRLAEAPADLPSDGARAIDAVWGDHRSPGLIEGFKDLIALRQKEFADSEVPGKRFGYQCNYAPLELLSASGARHLRLFRAASPDTVAKGERFTQSIYCDMAKSCLGLLSEGDPLYGALDKVYNFYTCNTVKRISEVMDRFVPVKLLNLPKHYSLPESQAFFRQELQDMRQDLEAETGFPITDETLRTEIRRRNELRRLLRKISDLRQLPHAPLTGQDFLELTKGYYYLGTEEALSELSRIYQVLSSRCRPEGPDRRLRFLLSGSVLADGDRKIHDILERDFDTLVVSEDICTGVKPFHHEVPEEGDPLAALAQGYLTQAPCAHMKPLTDAADFAVRLAKENRVDGVVYSYLKFCPSHSVGIQAYLRAFAEAGIPVLEISNDYSLSSEGQIRTRIEAFLEVLKDRQRTGAPV